MMTCIKILTLITLFCTSLSAHVDDHPKIFEKQLQTLSHLHHVNPPLLILFSGTPGMGKTFIAKNLEDHFKAVRLSSDVARELFRENEVSFDTFGSYREYSLNQLIKQTSNGTIVIDRSCDRTYDHYLSWAKKHGFNVFVIRMDVPRDTVEKRILARGINTREFLNQLNRSWSDYEAFNLTHPSDFVLDNSQDQVNLEGLYRAIEARSTFQKLNKGTPEYLKAKAKILSYIDHGDPKEYDIRNNLSEILPGLYIGNQVAATSIVKHHSKFISRILTLRSTTKPFKTDDINWKGIDIEDSAKTSIRSHFDEVDEYIEGTEKAIMIHCREGCSRSTTVIIAYLMKKFDLSLDEAYTYVKKKHPRTIPNKSFMKQLNEYEFKLQQDAKALKI